MKEIISRREALKRIAKTLALTMTVPLVNPFIEKNEIISPSKKDDLLLGYNSFHAYRSYNSYHNYYNYSSMSYTYINYNNYGSYCSLYLPYPKKT